jgi:pimeloyl-ACP methyl ester carboxylesterase
VPAREQSRARYPEEQGFVERDGVRVFWERYGEGGPAIVFVPPGMLVHSRTWKAQIPYFARRHRVLVLDGRGNGRTSRPRDPHAYSEAEHAADVVAVMDATGTERAIVVGGGRGAYRAIIVAAEHPERTVALLLAAPDWWLRPEFVDAFLAEPRERYGDSWDRLSPHYFRGDWEGFVRWWMPIGLPEPHSAKGIEDAVGWGLESDPETFFTAAQAPGLGGHELEELGRRIDCPVVVIEGELDAVAPPGQARLVAEATGGELVRFEGAGHALHGRHPVRFNLVLRELVERVAGA